VYFFHLTIDVQTGCNDRYEAYKIDAVDIAARAEGHVWSLVVRPTDSERNLYYQISGWRSERELDRSGSSADNRALIERARPYEMLNTTPALREPGALTVGPPPLLDVDGPTAWPCLHRTHRFASEASMTRMVESRAGCSEQSHTHILLKVDGGPMKVYEFVIGTCSVRENVTSIGLAEPPREMDCRIIALSR